MLVRAYYHVPQKVPCDGVTLNMREYYDAFATTIILMHSINSILIVY